MLQSKNLGKIYFILSLYCQTFKGFVFDLCFNYTEVNSQGLRLNFGMIFAKIVGRSKTCSMFTVLHFIEMQENIA